MSVPPEKLRSESFMAIERCASLVRASRLSVESRICGIDLTRMNTTTPASTFCATTLRQPGYMRAGRELSAAAHGVRIMPS